MISEYQHGWLKFLNIRYVSSPLLIEGVSGLISLLLCFIEISLCNANSVDPDQTPRSAASDLGLHCLPVNLLGVSRLK